MKFKSGGTALITGASSGIGYELAKIFAQEGYSLILVARREDKLTDLKKELEEKLGVTVVVLPYDLSKPNQADEVFAEVKKRKLRVDVLVNNAGFGKRGPFLNTDWEVLSEMIQVNITTLTQLTHLFLPLMVQRKGGRILNVASTAAFLPGPLMAIYYATKAYVLHFSEAIANELKGTGVTVTALCPGPTESEFQAVAAIHKNKAAGQKTANMPSSQEVARYGYRALQKGKVVAVHGLFNRLLVRTVRLIPRGVATSIIRSLQEKR